MENVTIQELGFDTWIDLYKMLEESNLQFEEWITLFWPAESPEVVIEDLPDMKELVDGQYEYHIPTDYIRAQAFRELWVSLPLKKNVETLIFKLKQIHDKSLIREEAAKFLNGLKTRKK